LDLEEVEEEAGGEVSVVPEVREVSGAEVRPLIAFALIVELQCRIGLDYHVFKGNAPGVVLL
jgi:hypothetical protein